MNVQKLISCCNANPAPVALKASW